MLPCDGYGTAILVFPRGEVWTPGSNDQPAQVSRFNSADWVAVHAAISVPTHQQQIEQIGQREGWRVLTREQEDGAFRLVELWLENRILFELLPPEFEAVYVQTMQPEVMEQILGQPIYPTAV